MQSLPLLYRAREGFGVCEMCHCGCRVVCTELSQNNKNPCLDVTVFFSKSDLFLFFGVVSLLVLVFTSLGENNKDFTCLLLNRTVLGS